MSDYVAYATLATLAVSFAAGFVICARKANAGANAPQDYLWLALAMASLLLAFYFAYLLVVGYVFTNMQYDFPD